MRLCNGLFLPSNAGRISAAAAPVIELSATNLVHWLDTNDNLNDSTPAARDFTAVSGPTYMAGPGGVGRAVVFDGTLSQHASRAGSTAYNLSVFTVAAWLRMTAVPPDHFTQLSRASGGLGYYLQWRSTGYWLANYNNISSPDPADTNADIPYDSSWNHYIIERDNFTGTTKVYKNNGTPVVLVNATAISNVAATIFINRTFSDYGSAAVAGHVLFSRGLSADERAILYNGGARLLYSDITWI